MRFGKFFLCLITLLFLLTAVFMGRKEQEPGGFLSVDVPYADRTENICSWEGDADYEFYLPGGVDPGSMVLRFAGSEDWTLDGRPLQDHMPCNIFSFNKPLTLAEDGEEMGTVTFFQSANVGALYVRTASGSMDRIHEVKGKEESGKLRLYTPEGDLCHDGAILAINGRGNSTWEEEKKSYSLELAADADLLGMGSAKKWILLSNSLDHSNLHNKVAYDFAREFGLAFSPASDWVDLYLNGEYAGLYLLCERNEVHPNRVAISQTDSFLVARDAYWRFEEQGRPYITTENNAALRIYHAGMDTDEMLALWQCAENAILSEDGIDPVTGKNWQELIDLESWVRKYLVDEGFGNKDATSLSQFYYYDGNNSGKIYAGPVWDYDLSMYFGTGDRQESVQQLFANIPGVYGSLWPNALYQKEEFYTYMVRLYETEFLPLLQHYQDTVIPAYAARIADAALLNASRWGYRQPEPVLAETMDYLSMRREFLDDIWLNGTDYCFVRATEENGSNRYYAIKPGDFLPSQLWRENPEEGWEYRWYDKDSGKRLTPEDAVFTDMEIRIRYEQVDVQEKTEETAVMQEAQSEPSPLAEEAVPVMVELPPLQRLAPVILFACMLMGLVLTEVCRWMVDRRKC